VVFPVPGVFAVDLRKDLKSDGVGSASFPSGPFRFCFEGVRIMNTIKIMLGVAMLICIAALDGVAQQTDPATAQATTPATPAANWSNFPPDVQAQAIRDQEWLTAYMMAHEGYRLNHMEALEDKFGKMTPTQLETLRMMYEQKRQSTIESEQLFRQAQAHQVAQAQMQIQNQQRAMGMINQEETAAATTEDQRLNQMHQEAFEANQDKQMMQNPYGMGGYMNPYGARGYGPYRGY
jgi:hypothetical protein